MTLFLLSFLLWYYIIRSEERVYNSRVCVCVRVQDVVTPQVVNIYIYMYVLWWPLGNAPRGKREKRKRHRIDKPPWQPNLGSTWQPETRFHPRADNASFQLLLAPRAHPVSFNAHFLHRYIYTLFTLLRNLRELCIRASTVSPMFHPLNCFRLRKLAEKSPNNYIII